MSDSVQAVTVVKVIVHSSDDADTKKIRSRRLPHWNPKPKDHFVSPKGNGDVILHAQLNPADSCGQITWEADGATITSPGVGTDACTAKVPRSDAKKIDVRIKSNGVELWSGTVWVVWATITPDEQTRDVIAERREVTQDNRVLESGTKLKMEEIKFTAEITPKEIFSDDERPEIPGGGTKVPLPQDKKRHVHYYSKESLVNGAKTTWDMSRQVHMRLLNPHLYPKSKLPPIVGWAFDSQPLANSVPVSYPEGDDDMARINPIGNDDAFPEKHNRPYDKKSYGILTSTDSPKLAMDDKVGQNNDTMEMRMHFREFVRVQLGDTWYRISDPQLWRVHLKFKRVNGQWADDGSAFALNNDGF